MNINMIINAMKTFKEFDDRPEFLTPGNPCFLPRSLYEAAKREGIDVRGYEPSRMIPNRSGRKIVNKR